MLTALTRTEMRSAAGSSSSVFDYTLPISASQVHTGRRTRLEEGREPAAGAVLVSDGGRDAVLEVIHNDVRLRRQRLVQHPVRRRRHYTPTSAHTHSQHAMS